jgi:hypothetical protein
MAPTSALIVPPAKPCVRQRNVPNGSPESYSPQAGTIETTVSFTASVRLPADDEQGGV